MPRAPTRKREHKACGGARRRLSLFPSFLPQRTHYIIFSPRGPGEQLGVWIDVKLLNISPGPPGVKPLHTRHREYCTQTRYALRTNQFSVGQSTGRRVPTPLARVGDNVSWKLDAPRMMLAVTIAYHHDSFHVGRHKNAGYCSRSFRHRSVVNSQSQSTRASIDLPVFRQPCFSCRHGPRACRICTWNKERGAALSWNKA
jgi:hypothetical protein